MLRTVGLSVLLGMSQFVYAEGEPDLCTPTENIHFTCAAKEKILSVCLSKEFTAEEGKLSYRFGTKESIELDYSSIKSNLNDKFKFGYSDYPKGSTTELSFVIDGNTYTLHRDSHVYKRSTAGVFVEKDNEQVAYIACDSDDPDNENKLDDLEELSGFERHKARKIGTASAFEEYDG